MIDQHDSLAEKFLRKWFWLYLFSFIIAPIGYIVKILVSHDVSVEEIGIIYWVMSLVMLILSFNDLWMAESLNKFIPEYVTQKRYDKVKTILVYALLAQVITGGIIFSVLFFWSTFLGTHYFHDSRAIEVVQVFSFFFLWFTFFHVLNVFFQAIQNTFLQRFTEFLRMIGILWFTAYAFFWEKWDIFHYSLAWVLWLYIGIFAAFYFFIKHYYFKYLRTEKIIFSFDFFKKIFSYALLVFLWSQASTILSQVDMQMIIYILGAKDAWFYSNYLSIISIPFVLIGPIFAFLFPVFSEMIAKNENEKIKWVKSIFFKNFFVFSFVFSILFFVFWPIISIILFGEKFEMSGIILQYAIFFIAFNFLLQINFNILAANGKIKERLKIILKALGFNIITNLIFIYTFWVAWAALATGLWWVLIWYLSEKELQEYHTSFDLKYIGKNIAFFGSIWVGLFLFILPYFWNIENRWYMLIFLALISLLYFLIYIVFNLKDFKYLYNEVKKVRGKR